MATSTWARGHPSTSRPTRSGGHTSVDRCGTCADPFSTSDAGRAGRSCIFVREGSEESGSTTHRLLLRCVGGEALQMSRCGRLLNLKGLARSTPSSFSEADSVSSETGPCSAIAPQDAFHYVRSRPHHRYLADSLRGPRRSAVHRAEPVTRTHGRAVPNPYSVSIVLHALVGLPHGLAGRVRKCCRRHRLGTSAAHRWPRRTLCRRPRKAVGPDRAAQRETVSSITSRHPTLAFIRPPGPWAVPVTCGSESRASRSAVSRADGSVHHRRVESRTSRKSDGRGRSQGVPRG